MGMSHQRVREAFDACAAAILKAAPGTVPERDPDPMVAMTPDRPGTFFPHLAFCCEMGKQFATEAEALREQAIDCNEDPEAANLALKCQSRMEKAMRWLGFVQGALWLGARVPLEELKKMNMSPEEAFSQERV